jgi:hypothetical protein
LYENADLLPGIRADVEHWELSSGSAHALENHLLLSLALCGKVGNTLPLLLIRSPPK